MKKNTSVAEKQQFKDKYRIQSHRMPQWDYSCNSTYFITLVTQKRECNLGHIIDDEMVLSGYGQIVANEWQRSFEIRNELFLDEYIIMPNHLHAIVVLDSSEENTGVLCEGIWGGMHGEVCDGETHGRASLQVRRPRSISSFIACFKSGVNSKIDDYIDNCGLDIPKYNRNNHFFQSNYYDRIIRNNSEYQRIKEYIIENPLKWNSDTINPLNKNQKL